MSKTMKSKLDGYRSEMVGCQAPSGSDLIYLIGAGLRGLICLRPRKPGVQEAARPERVGEPGQNPGALRRSPMAAGIPGGVTLLLDRSDPRRRRR